MTEHRSFGIVTRMLSSLNSILKEVTYGSHIKT